jgi:hypothetical protein
MTRLRGRAGVTARVEPGSHEEYPNARRDPCGNAKQGDQENVARDVEENQFGKRQRRHGKEALVHEAVRNGRNPKGPGHRNATARHAQCRRCSERTAGALDDCGSA